VCHRRSVPRFGVRRKRRTAAGTVLLEVTMSLVVLTVLGLSLLKLAINVTAPRQWTLQQTVSDAYMSYEKALAQRVPFEQLRGDDSPWPEYPGSSVMDVELGKLPGGASLTGTIARTRHPDENNYPVAGGSGTPQSNPAGIEGWRLQSILTYEVGGLTYAKARTVIRTQ
jgi:hypothetical protein